MSCWRPAMLTDPRRALLAAVGLGIAAAVVVALVWSTGTRSGLQWVDDRFLSLMRDVRWPPLTTLAKAMAFIGSVWVAWPVRIAVLAILARRRHWLHFVAFAGALVTSEACIGPVKALFDRPRPAGGLIATSGAAFPSGHAVGAAVTAVGLVIVLLPPGHTRWVWERRAAVFASMMALSRTYLGVHWLSDVVGGALVGSALAIGWPAALVLWRNRVEPRRSLAAGP